MRMLLLAALVAGPFSVGLCHRTNAMETNESERAASLAVQRFGERLVARLYNRSETKSVIVRDRMVTKVGTLYWLEVRRLDSGRTYPVWERWYGAGVREIWGNPCEFWLTAGEGEQIALTYFDGDSPIMFEVDTSTELNPDGDPRSIHRKSGEAVDVSERYIPLKRAVEQELGLPGTYVYEVKPRSIYNVVWKDDAWHVTFRAAEREWLFVRPKDAKQWRWELKSEERRGAGTVE